MISGILFNRKQTTWYHRHRTDAVVYFEYSRIVPMSCPLVGSNTAKEKREKTDQLQSIPPSEPLVIVATGKYVGEGFDYARLDTLFLVSRQSEKSVANYSGQFEETE